jgi:hypothetical protein
MIAYQAVTVVLFAYLATMITPGMSGMRRLRVSKDAPLSKDASQRTLRLRFPCPFSLVRYASACLSGQTFDALT